MFRPLYVAATGLTAMEQEMMDITNNMANAKTVAFKGGRTEMESLFYVQKSFQSELEKAMQQDDGIFLDNPPSFGTGVKISSTSYDFSQGKIEVTNNPLDLAIQGEGFFEVKMPDGSLAYTRAGNFRIDNEGNIVDPNGHILEPGISVPKGTTAISISQDGTIYAAVDNQTSKSEIGQIHLVRFSNTKGLKSLGQNLYAATEISGEAESGTAAKDGYGGISQYSLEQSNVNVISELMRMVTVQRVFDTITKAVQSYENMLASLQNIRA